MSDTQTPGPRTRPQRGDLTAPRTFDHADRAPASWQGGATARVVERMRVERSRRRWSLEHLSRLLARAGCAIPRTQLADLEAGRKREASVDLLLALSRVFVVPAAEWLGVPRCEACAGRPPVGFSCNGCGAGRPR